MLYVVCNYWQIIEQAPINPKYGIVLWIKVGTYQGDIRTQSRARHVIVPKCQKQSMLLAGAQREENYAKRSCLCTMRKQPLIF